MVKTYRTLEGGGELAPKVAPRKLGLFTSKLASFYRKSVEQSQGLLEIQNFHPRADLSFCVFPCFAAFEGLKIPNAGKKQHESGIVTPPCRRA